MMAWYLQAVGVALALIIIIASGYLLRYGIFYEGEAVSLTTDRGSECLDVIQANGQQVCYLVLSDDEIALGYVRPVRYRYRHVACGGETSMAGKIAETYARRPDFYGGTFCARCGAHFSLVGRDDVRQFEWVDERGKTDGSFVGA